MATLNLTAFIEMVSQGRTVALKQGDVDDTADTPLALTVTGTTHDNIGVLATASGRTIWDDDEDFPADWDFFYFWADQNCYLQLVGATSNVILPIVAGVPYIQAGDQILAAADTTDMSSEPTLEDIDHVRIWNQSGNSMNYAFAFID